MLRDNVDGEREQGIAAGLAWGPVAEATVVYIDRGISPGMKRGIADAEAAERPIEYRLLEDSTSRRDKNGTGQEENQESSNTYSGINMLYKGSTGARNDIIAGQIDMMFDSVPTMAPMIEAGRVKALGTSGRVRSEALPNVPTLMEAGLPGYEATIWLGVMAPAGTPERIVDKLNTEINNILSLPHIREVWRAQGATPVIMTPGEFGGFVQSEIERWANIIKANGIQGD